MGLLKWWLYWRWRSNHLYYEIAEVLRYDASLPMRPWRCKFCSFRVLGGPDHHPNCRLYVRWH